MHCCVVYQIIRFANQKLIVDGLGSELPVCMPVSLQIKLMQFAVSKKQKPLDSNKEIWTASKTLSNMNYLSESKNEAMQIVGCE